MRQLITVIILVLFYNLGTDAQHSEPFVAIFPECIMLTIPGNPATTAAVSWRTEFKDTMSRAQLARVDASTTFINQAVTTNGSYSPWETGSTSFMGHKVIFDNLRPETQYAYRVGNGNQWSEWFHLKTASDKIKPFSFLYLGDMQDNILSFGSRVIRQAYSHFSDSQFILFAGDLVSRSFDEVWKEFFDSGSWIFGMVPSLPTPGNHEYYRIDEQKVRPFSRHWHQIFILPENGPTSKQNGRTYYMDYQGVRFISIDSPAMSFDDDDSSMILEWLDQTLVSNPNRWSVVFTHFPIYSCSSEVRDRKDYREAIQPILEIHGVDLVLHGHDHTYCRGQNLTKISDKCKNPPMYVVSVAGGPKMFSLDENIWADRFASEIQLYQHISFNSDTLSFKTFTAVGELYDAFKLIKKDNSFNELVEIFIDSRQNKWGDY